ncbi:hypothetical protein FQA39_LY08457 [Lamprigera yunnana]|nr:hypothetical protein FQA39_LY08457 [Lamprigera yunnana]
MANNKEKDAKCSIAKLKLLLGELNDFTEFTKVVKAEETDPSIWEQLACRLDHIKLSPTEYRALSADAEIISLSSESILSFSDFQSNYFRVVAHTSLLLKNKDIKEQQNIANQSEKYSLLKKNMDVVCKTIWTKTIDLKLAVEHLYKKLGALEFDTNHEAIYDMEKCYTVQQCGKLRNQYKSGRKSYHSIRIVYSVYRDGSKIKDVSSENKQEGVRENRRNRVYLIDMKWREKSSERKLSSGQLDSVKINPSVACGSNVEFCVSSRRGLGFKIVVNYKSRTPKEIMPGNLKLLNFLPSVEMYSIYELESWPIATDAYSAVERMRRQFTALVFEADHETVYGLGKWHSEAYLQYLLVLQLDRCRAKEDLDSCEPYKNVTRRHFCDLANLTSRWTPFQKQIQPKFTCPAKKLILQLDRCRAKEDLDSCEPYKNVTTNNFCDLVNSVPFWNGFKKQSQPEMLCPAKMGTYLCRNCTFDTTIVTFLPIHGWYWKLKILIYENVSSKLAMCMLVTGQMQ